ncbi:MAG: DNA gyrase subunit A [Anaerolineae bacterium]|nr:DNA gyrase subunit A [Anaerolineae bacterium]MDW8099084.1 DNA gyrase subunit A [Anaerolineae bacterium]
MNVETTAIGTVKQVAIEQEMQQAYLDYAMSVIVARALPDVRDGLKPVQRRILYAMHDMGLTPDREYKKSARIVGEVLGKYHPHGDAPVYEAMVRMAQDFSMRYPLIDGQGNFGSMDGDNAAAMRYTEARMARMAMEMLADIEKDTVDFVPNFDGTLKEPSVLPALLPNLLINGSSGIAVGMATNIPPHNLSEVCDAVAYLIDHWDRVDDVTIEDLLQFIQGPDFPTGGIVYRYGRDPSSNGNGAQVDVIAAAYAQGRGRFVVQARAHIEEMSRNRHRIIVTELPYQTNKTNLIERIAELVREGRIEGITDLRDESDRQGMRIVIELTRTVEPREVLAQLFRLTPMQQTFGVSMLALVDGEPRLLSLKRMLQLYVEHRQEIIRRRSQHDLQRARERAHILEGLLIALDYLDEVIATIRRSPDAETARTRLMNKFKLTEIQAQAILDMQLRRLARLERERIKEEYEEKRKLITYLEDLLAHPAKILALIRDEVVQLEKQYGDDRRTQIVDRMQGTLTARDLIEDRPIWLTVSADGMVARLPAEAVTKASVRAAAQGADVGLFSTNLRHELFLFTSDGRMARLAIHRIPEGDGVHWADLCDLGRRDRVVAALALPRFDDVPADAYLALVTRLGKIKRVALADVLAASGVSPVMNVEAGDDLGWARVIDENAEVLLVTQGGQAIRFKVSDVRPMGLLASGVGAIKLGEGDRVVAFNRVNEKASLVTLTEAGYAKRTPLAEFPVQGRFGVGVVAHKVTVKTGPMIGAAVVQRSDALLVVLTERGMVKPLAAREVPEMGRATQGKDVLALSRGDRVKALVELVGADPVIAGETSTVAEKGAPAAERAKGARIAGPASSKPAAEAKPEKGLPSKRRLAVEAELATVTRGRLSGKKAGQPHSTASQAPTAVGKADSRARKTDESTLMKAGEPARRRSSTQAEPTAEKPRAKPRRLEQTSSQEADQSKDPKAANRRKRPTHSKP